MLHTLSKAETAVNVSMEIVLTDGDHIYDSRCICPVDLYTLAEIAQKESNGELWWEPHSIFLGRKLGIEVKAGHELPFDLITESFTPLATISSNLQLCLHDDWGLSAASREQLQCALDQADKLTEMLQIVQRGCCECD